MATQPTLCDACELDYFYSTLNRDELLIQKLGFSGVV